jgi:hypothetical protein
MCGVMVEEASCDGGGRRFESLRETLHDLLIILIFFGAGPKTSVLVDDLSTRQH